MHCITYNSIQGLVSISDKTSYCKISQSLRAVRFVFRIIRTFWNLTGALAVMLPMCLSNFKVMRYLILPILQLQVFMRSNDKLSYWILKWGPALSMQLNAYGNIFFLYVFENVVSEKTAILFGPLCANPSHNVTYRIMYVLVWRTVSALTRGLVILEFISLVAQQGGK